MSPLDNFTTPHLQQNTIQSVTELTRSIKLILENGFSFISVCGEISNIRKPYSGHLYFTLKDEFSQLKAVLFKPQQRYLAQELKAGDKIICRGRLSLYEPRGEYQIIVDSVEFSGEGDLQLSYEVLKKKLDAEGLFNTEHKKDIPFFPASIALITSPTGAAVHDFISIAQSRFAAIPIEIYPVRVQGEEAAEEISRAVIEANKRGISDVIVICRGGGSLEDLWPFNNEILARTVFNSGVPVVSAVGHEIDYTILDFVADFRSPTPSAAAECIVPSRKDLKLTISQLKNKTIFFMNQQISEYRKTVKLQKRLLQDPTTILQNIRLRLDQLQNSLIHSLKDVFNLRKQELKENCHRLHEFSPQLDIEDKKIHVSLLKKALTNHFQHTVTLNRSRTDKALSLLSAVNPKAVLQRGYSIVYTDPDNKIVRSSKQVNKGDNLHIVTGSGNFSGTVTNTD